MEKQSGGCTCYSFADGRALSDRNPVGCSRRASRGLKKGECSRLSLASYRIAFVYERERISGCFGDMSDALRFSNLQAFVRAERTVPERILGQRIAPCCDRICSRQRSHFAIAWQNNIRVHVGCACGVKHKRGWTE
jgi:hypothetical protein